MAILKSHPELNCIILLPSYIFQPLHLLLYHSSSFRNQNHRCSLPSQHGRSYQTEHPLSVFQQFSCQMASASAVFSNSLKTIGFDIAIETITGLDFIAFLVSSTILRSEAFEVATDLPL